MWMQTNNVTFTFYQSHNNVQVRKLDLRKKILGSCKFLCHEGQKRCVNCTCTFILARLDLAIPFLLGFPVPKI